MSGVADRSMRARRASVCPLCGGPVMVTMRIVRLITTREWVHMACALKMITDDRGRS